ncbi:hypothetical protein D3C75_868780 [compost metagenome]
MRQLRNQHAVHFFTIRIDGFNLLGVWIFFAIECPGAVKQYIIVCRQYNNIAFEIILVILHALPDMIRVIEHQQLTDISQ